MDITNNFLEIMKKTNNMVIASSDSNNQPNLRTVNFYYSPDEKILYFLTLKNSQKTVEFEQNNKVAFTTIPIEGVKHVKAKGIIRKSQKSVQDLKNKFIEKIPEIKKHFDEGENFMVLYEVSFTKATVTIGVKNTTEFEIL
jgi:pyridoxamine 5'-phosphate oxidase family protein